MMNSYSNGNQFIVWESRARNVFEMKVMVSRMEPVNSQNQMKFSSNLPDLITPQWYLLV